MRTTPFSETSALFSPVKQLLFNHTEKNMNEAVRLKYGESETFSPGGGVTGVEITKANVKVANIAFQKDVALHYQKADGSWAERSLTFQNNFGDYDLFTANFNDLVTTQFVIRYSANGRTFWDNNNSANYQIDSGRPNVVGNNVVLNKAVARRGTEAGGGFVFTTSWVEGEIYVNNLSFNKNVGILLTANGWKNFQDTNASFGGVISVATGLSEVEVWKFKTPELNLDESTPDFRFAVFYNKPITGEWFWDNNFGQDYKLSKVNLTSIQ
jgi:Carbohydrate/starch-binding module (family 21)